MLVKDMRQKVKILQKLWNRYNNQYKNKYFVIFYKYVIKILWKNVDKEKQNRYNKNAIKTIAEKRKNQKRKTKKMFKTKPNGVSLEATHTQVVLVAIQNIIK